MSESRAIFIINILKSTVNVYFDTFFVFYFFKVVNYDIVPLAKYYLTLYLFVGVGFFLIRKAMKRNHKVPYFQIGVSLQAFYIALIMLLKDNIVNYVFLVGFVKGIADGFYHFPKNILNSEKIDNKDRQKFSGLVNAINKTISIAIPLILGVALTYMSYTDLGKIFFVLFIVMFLISFYIKDQKIVDRSFEYKEFLRLVQKNKKVKKSLLIPFLSGFTYSSGVLGLVVTLCKINNFKTNFNLGVVDSICAILSLLICILFTAKIKEKNFKNVLIVAGTISFFSLIAFSFYPIFWILVIYLLVRYSCILVIDLISDNVMVNLTNIDEIGNRFKAEYYLTRDLIFMVSRCSGYLILFVLVLLTGMNYINYILIIPAIAIFTEAYIVGKLSENKK